MRGLLVLLFATGLLALPLAGNAARIQVTEMLSGLDNP